jgi:hypothetical protein
MGNQNRLLILSNGFIMTLVTKLIAPYASTPPASTQQLEIKPKELAGAIDYSLGGTSLMYCSDKSERYEILG